MSLGASVMLRLLLSALLLVENLKDAVCSPIREANTALQEGWLIAAWKYMESNPETLEELMSDEATMEGDIILSTDRNAVERRWPVPDIPYVISSELTSRTDDILAAMAMVSEQTCVKFFKRANEMNYLLFKTSRGCSSYVGFIGGEQPVFVGPPCRAGNIAHEILHALGFHHEHTRMDREQYVTVLPHNIMAGMERNFKKHAGQTFNLPYDTGSIMHYGRGFFSANGLPTIVPNDNVKETMGQRRKLTTMDVQRVRHLYNCDDTEKEAATEGGDAEKAEDWNFKMLIQRLKKLILSTFVGNQNQNENQNQNQQSNTTTNRTEETQLRLMKLLQSPCST